MTVRGNIQVKRARFTEKKRRQWFAREKLMVVAYYEHGHSVRATAEKFDIEPKQVRDWKAKKKQLQLVAPHIRRLNQGARAKYPELENALVQWVKNLRQGLKTVTRYMVQAKARSMRQKPELQSLYPDIQHAVFSQKWVDGFLTRHNLTNRRRTTIAQRLPDDYVEQRQDFFSFVLFRRQQHNYPLELIGNMDETSIAFNMPTNTTIDERGTKTISILSTGHEKPNFTVVLACLANGTKLPPVIIFKLVNIPRQQFPNGVIIRANPSGWMNENEMLWWIEHVWSRRAQGNNPRSLLVLDSFSGHTTDPVKRRFKEKKTDMAVIPGGMTSQLQPLDVALNKPFKSKVL